MIPQMISGEQVRAARALLDWKQTDLAEKTGLSVPSINNIERNIGSPRVVTMNLVRDILQSAGIEFIDSDGVRRHREVFEMTEFQGEGFVEKLNDDLFFCMRGPEDEVLMYGIDENLFAQNAPNELLRWEAHLAKTNFSQRALISEGNKTFVTDPNIYRWTIPQMVGLVPYIVYHDRLTMIMWETKRVILIRSKAIADTFRMQFDFLWEQAKLIPPDSVNSMHDPAFRAKLLKKAKK